MKNNKTILITGAGSGIGKDSAITLAKLGYHVLATTEFEEQAEKLNEFAKSNSLSIESFKLDVTNKQDREKILKYEVDILINNAGIGESGSLAEIDIDRVRKNFETNVFSSFELSQLALKGMLKRDEGKIIFVSSLAGRIVVMPYLASYSMTKFALSAGAQSLRNEMKEISKNVHIVVIEPGAYHTGFNQKITETKYEWMNESSYFYRMINKIKKNEERQFKLTESKSLDTIVKKIVEACEAIKPRFRYSAPWWQSLGVKIIRIFGK
jgi:short-subunit dehydrogenase